MWIDVCTSVCICTYTNVYIYAKKKNAQGRKPWGMYTYVYAKGNGGQLKGGLCKTIMGGGGKNNNKCWGWNKAV